MSAAKFLKISFLIFWQVELLFSIFRVKSETFVASVGVINEFS